MILLISSLILQNISILLICLIYIYFVSHVNQYKAQQSTERQANTFPKETNVILNQLNIADYINIYKYV